MAAVSAIWNHAATAGQALPSVTPTDSSSSSTSSSGTESATISANDFLTLLVTEMQNQDPTANTDPNEYINQLVNVNSLEQLISINQNLSTALGVSPTGAATNASGTAPQKTSSTTSAAVQANGTTGNAPATQLAGLRSVVQSVGVQHAPGNLSIPAANPAALRVAQALGGRSHAR